MAKKQTISVIERRLQGPSVFRTPSQPIPLKDNSWTLYWCNTTISPQQLWDFIHNKGWVYCLPEDLVCPVEEVGALVRDGRIVIGERGQEVLMKMPTHRWDELQKRKTEENIKQTFSKKQLKDAMVAGVGAEHGDRAAEYVAHNVNAISVTDARGPEEAV